MTQSETSVQQCVGQTLMSSDGEKIGKVEEVYLDQDTRQPEWFAVKTGWFGNRISFVPITGANWGGDDISVSYTKAQVKDAPHAEPDGQLSRDEEAALYDYYGLSYSERRSDTGLPAGDTNENRRGSSDNAMTRSEEEMVTGKQTREAGRARLVKYVETEHKSVTVPIQRQRAKLVTEPITDENRDEAMSGPDIRESAHEETLYEEEPVVGTRTVPKERVRLEKDSETEDREVAADLRKERVRTEGDVESERRP